MPSIPGAFVQSCCCAAVSADFFSCADPGHAAAAGQNFQAERGFYARS